LEKLITCSICNVEYPKPDTSKHHVMPKLKGGRNGRIEKACGTCHGQIHALFTEKELASMTFEELLETGEMRKYIHWKQRHPGLFRHKASSKVKDWKKGHR
jgi:5-methylcytosine-specific restriction protein A